jgi:hypothetical protein
MDDLMTTGPIPALGGFLDGRSGYALGEGDAVTTVTNVTMFSASFDMTVEKITPYEVGKQVNRARLNAVIAAKN